MNQRDSNGWGKFSDGELVCAAQLMIAPDWLKERRTIIALLEHFEFMPVDAADILASGEPLNDGPVLLL